MLNWYLYDTAQYEYIRVDLSGLRVSGSSRHLPAIHKLWSDMQYLRQLRPDWAVSYIFFLNASWPSTRLHTGSMASQSIYHDSISHVLV